MKRCSMSLAIREMQMRCHFTPTRIAVIRKIMTNVSEDVEKLEPSHTAGGNAKWYSHFGKQSGSSPKR